MLRYPNFLGRLHDAKWKYRCRCAGWCKAIQRSMHINDTNPSCVYNGRACPLDLDLIYAKKTVLLLALGGLRSYCFAFPLSKTCTISA